MLLKNIELSIHESVEYKSKFGLSLDASGRIKYYYTINNNE